MAEELQRPDIHRSAKVHKSAVIHPSVKIGENVKIGPRVKIDAGATVGADTRIDEAAEIGKNVEIADGNVRIGNHARIGDDTRIESAPRATRIHAGEYALAELERHQGRDTAKPEPERSTMDGRLRWDTDGDGTLRVAVDAGYAGDGKRVDAGFTTPEDLERWLDENSPALGERTEPGKGRMGAMRMADPGPVRSPDYTVGPDSRVGRSCVIEAGCHVGVNARIGDDAYLQHNCRLDDDIEIQSARDRRYDDGTARMRSTYIGPGTKVETGVRVEEGCWVGAGSHLRAGCRLGANTLTEGFSTVEPGAELPAGSRTGFKQLSKRYNAFEEHVDQQRINEERGEAENEIQQLKNKRASGQIGISQDAQVDPTAHVHPEATVMTGARVGPDATVAKGAVIGPLALVREDCTIGEGAIIGTRAQVMDRCHVGENVEIEHECIIKNEAKLQDCPTGTKATGQPTRIGVRIKA